MSKSLKQKPLKGWIYEHHEDGVVEETFTFSPRAWCWEKACDMYAWSELHEVKKAGRVRRVEVRIL